MEQQIKTQTDSYNAPTIDKINPISYISFIDGNGKEHKYKANDVINTILEILWERKVDEVE